MISDVILDIANDYVNTSINKVPGTRKGFFIVNNVFILIKCFDIDDRLEISIDVKFLKFLDGYRVRLSDSNDFFIIFCFLYRSEVYKVSLGLNDFFVLVKYPKVTQKIKLNFFEESIGFVGLNGALDISLHDHYLNKILGCEESACSSAHEQAAPLLDLAVNFNSSKKDTFIEIGEFKINCAYKTLTGVNESRLNKSTLNKTAIENTYKVFFREQEFAVGYFVFNDGESDHLRLLSAPEAVGVSRLENGLRMGVKKLSERDFSDEFISRSVDLNFNSSVYGIELSQARIKDDGKWSNAFSASGDQLAFGIGFDTFDALCSCVRSEINKNFFIELRRDMLKKNGSKTNYLYCTFNDKEIIPVIMYVIAKLAPLCYRIFDINFYKKIY